jgi:hypothetical protein
MSIPSTATPDSKPTFSMSTSTGSPFKDKLIASLDIPVELTDHREIDLAYAWKKYKACLQAISTCNSLWENKELRHVFDRKPTQTDIISVFKGKTQWHLTYSKAFPKLAHYPAMVSWLENSDDKLSDLELWGVEKAVYGFSDLFEWLDNSGVGLRGAGKGKEKEVAKGKAKEKEKEKKKDKGKGREKEVTGGKKKKVRMDK